MRRLRLLVSLTCVVALLLLSAMPAIAAGPKRIFITKSDEKGVGQANVTFELYQDTNGNGVRDGGEPLLQTKVTDATGHATFDPVNPGNYVVHEVTPAGYKDKPDEAVVIPNAKGPGPQLVYQNEPKPANHRVNDPTGDTSIDDGTHVLDFGPSIAVAPNGEDVLVAWNHSAGFGPPNRTFAATALSGDSGDAFADVTEPPTGPNALILGEPSVAYDPINDRWILATDGIVNTGSGLERPIFVSVSGGPFGFWNNPVNTFPDIPPDPALAHNPSLAIDTKGKNAGTVYLGFTVSHGDGTSEIMATRSTDGGQTWRTPTSVSGVGKFDIVDLEVAPAPSDRIYFSYNYYGDVGTSDQLIRRSDDGAKTFSAAFPIGVQTPRSGTEGQCTGSSARTVFGESFVFDAPRLAIDPSDANHLFATFSVHGAGGDESDVVSTTSTDGGKTWSSPEPIGLATGTQFEPHIATTPDGRVGITYFDSQDGSTVDPFVSYLDPFANTERPPYSLTDGNPFPLGNLDPNFDTHFNDCFGLGGPDVFAPGSGFFFAWSDGRDPGPAGNNGVDPNIYFAHDEGPFLDTSTSLAVSKTAATFVAHGTVAPRPIPKGVVVVTLFRDTGGGFQQVRKKNATTDGSGGYSMSFPRPNGGTCQITAVFKGSEGREPSPTLTKTFAC